MKKILGTIILFLLGLYLVNLSVNTGELPNNRFEPKSKYDSIIEKGEIEVGYIPYDKSFIVDPNTGEYSGIFYEVMDEVGKRLDLEIIYKHELGWSDMITALQSDKIDMMVTGIWPSSSRTKYVEYIEPLYYSPLYVYTGFDNTNFDNALDNINNSNVKIGVIDGEMTSIIAESDFPKAQKYSNSQLTNIDQLMLDLVANKTDVTFLEPSVAQGFMKNNPGKIKRVISDSSIRKFKNSMIVKKGYFALQSMISNTIIELENEGFIKKVIDKYDDGQGFFIQ